MCQQLEAFAHTSDLIWKGDRVIDFPGLPSQRCGTVIDFAAVHGQEGLYPVVWWDVGYFSASSYAWGLRKLHEQEQLSLFPSP
jgi:hypothetical protein